MRLADNEIRNITRYLEEGRPLPERYRLLLFEDKRMRVNWKYDYLVRQIHRTAYKCHESYIIGSLLHDESLSDLKPCTQHYIKIDGGYALIDLFYPQLDYAIEIDEPHHLNTISPDRIRQSDIEEKIKCKFRRIKISEGDVLTQISEVKRLLREERDARTSQGKFEEWVEPKRLDIAELKKNYQQSLFIKIRGEVRPDLLMAKQTGFWRIDGNKRERIKSIVIVHDGIISRVFTEIKWYTWPENPSKVGYRGVEDDKHTLVGTVVTNWKTQQTITYSHDFY